jgi:hypothetical protein
MGLCIRVVEGFGLVVPTWPPEAEARLSIGGDGRRSWRRSTGFEPMRVKGRQAQCQRYYCTSKCSSQTSQSVGGKAKNINLSTARRTSDERNRGKVSTIVSPELGNAGVMVGQSRGFNGWCSAREGPNFHFHLQLLARRRSRCG